MIYRIETIWRRTKWLSSRNRFVVWLFGMSKSVGDDSRRGLIILQVDGLSRAQLELALGRSTMPFLKRLLDKEHYHLHSLYSGVPSSTPAVQGELFYGVPMCVPAFRFKRPEDKASVVMLDPKVAESVEKQLEESGDALLTGGSAYSNMFTGGAEESSFCASSLGWSHLIPTSNLFKMVVFFLLNVVSMVRVLMLMVVELILAIIDLVLGVFSGRSLLKEINLVAVRVAISVLLRELVTIGVKLDAARGLPVIHANFLGYDEQAHRRGPSSKYAHWSLKGIDRAIKRIWLSAKQSEYRDYDIWIYSDHGQQQTRSYPLENGSSINTQVNRVLARYLAPDAEEVALDHSSEDDDLNKMQSQRVTLLGSKYLTAWVSKLIKPARRSPTTESIVAAMGPLGFIYIPNDSLRKSCGIETKKKIAADLIEIARIPMVLLASKKGHKKTALVWSQGGQFTLPQDKSAVLGSAHPFLQDACDDLIELCHHAYSGDFVISGWTPHADAMSFRLENGAHAGPGDIETHAFALLPQDLSLPNNSRPYLRVRDLYQCAKNELSSVERPDKKVTSALTSRQHSPGNELRVMSYNVHSLIGMDGKLSAERIARVIAMYDPDIVALQELNADLKTSADQSIVLAKALEMDCHFHVVRAREDGKFGNAILSKHPIRLLQSYELAGGSKLSGKGILVNALTQPRGVMEVAIEFAGHDLKVVNTHLGLTPDERKKQVEDMIDRSELAGSNPPAILCGDFNATAQQLACRRVAHYLQDTEVGFESSVRRAKTFPGRYPTLRLDHIFVHKQVKVSNVLVPSNHLTKVASDHLPLIVDLDITDLLSNLPITA